MTGKRGPKISREVMALMTDMALYSNQKRTELAEELEKIIQERGWRAPTIETMEKWISKIRNRKDEQDEPWSISTLDKFPIPPEALPAVLKEYRRHKDPAEDDPISKSDFTIRQAKWVARLSKTDCKWSLPYYIARSEQLYEVLGEDIDLEMWDRSLAGLPGQADKWHVPFLAAFSVWGILKDDPTKGGKKR